MCTRVFTHVVIVEEHVAVDPDARKQMDQYDVQPRVMGAIVLVCKQRGNLYAKGCPYY
jgi:hypothetical protein